MPSHTFTRTGDWQDSIKSNVAAAAAARREHQTAEELHASDYEIYAYLQTAQDDSAKRVLDSLPEIAARFDPVAIIGGAGGPSSGYFALAAIPARYAIERRDWRQAAQLMPRETPFPYTEAMTWFARGIGSSRLGQANARAKRSLLSAKSVIVSPKRMKPIGRSKCKYSSLKSKRWLPWPRKRKTKRSSK
jgi:hypothetical protein